MLLTGLDGGDSEGTHVGVRLRSRLLSTKEKEVCRAHPRKDVDT